MNKRKTIRDLAREIKVPQTSIYRYIQKGWLRRHTSALKPLLTDKNKKERVDFVERLIDKDGKFEDFFDIIHIDEKWFYMTDQCVNYILAEGEPGPQRKVRSMRYIDKVMCLTAIARPRDGWDGKVGCFFFLKKKKAERNSKNRPKGSLELKNVSVSKTTYQRLMIDHVLPAIRRKCPPAMTDKTIIIQQDNAPPHSQFNMDECEELAAKAQELGLHLKIVNQPPNSPDFNVNDLGFFRAIMALQYQEKPKSKKELRAAVKQAFDNYNPDKLGRVWVTWQSCMREAWWLQGDNSYRIPHMKKDLMEAAGIRMEDLRLSLVSKDEEVEEDDEASWYENIDDVASWSDTVEVEGVMDNVESEEDEDSEKDKEEGVIYEDDDSEGVE